MNIPFELNNEHKLFLALFEIKPYVTEEELLQLHFSDEKMKEILVCFFLFVFMIK